MGNAVIVGNFIIHQDSEGRYFLNDLHRAAGGLKRDQPSNWLQNKQTKALISKIDVNSPGIPGELQNKSVNIVYSGPLENQGTYVTKKLVFAYAMWINSDFYDHVLEVYEAHVTKPKSLDQIYLILANELRRALPELEITDRSVLISKNTGNRNFSGETREQTQYFRKMDEHGLPGIVVMNKRPYQIWVDWLSKGEFFDDDICDSIYKSLYLHCGGRGYWGLPRIGYRKKLEPFQVPANFEEIHGIKSADEAKSLAADLAKIISNQLIPLTNSNLLALDHV